MPSTCAVLSRVSIITRPFPQHPSHRYVRLHFFDEDYLNKQDAVPDEFEEGHKDLDAPEEYDDN